MEVLTPSTHFRTPRTNIHKNASMTPKGRAHLVREIDRIGLKAAAAAAGLSTRTARKWQRRVALHGAAGWQTAARARTAARLAAAPTRSSELWGCGGLAKLPPLQGAVAIRRYERKSPGELLHMDTKKLHRFDKPGHRVTGDRTQNNGSAYKSRRFAKLLRRLGIRHIRTRPYTPRTNGKAERFIQNLAARMGLRLHLSKFGCPRQRAGPLDVSLQLPSPSLSHFPPPSSLSPRI
jgi:hypothetical protein